MTKNIKIPTILTVIALGIFFSGFSAQAQSAPDLRDLSANVTGPHNANLSIFVDPNGSSTQVHFKYWTGSTFRERLYLGVRGDSFVKVEVGLLNLLEGSNYSYQVVAQNSSGSTTSSTGTFSTPGSNQGSSGGSGTGTSTGGASNNSNNSNGSNQGTATAVPSVITNGPVSATANSAVVNGSINPNNGNTNFWFEFGTTQSLGQTTSTQSMGGGNSWQLVTGNISNLESGKIYYYRVVAQNNLGISRGDIRNVTTSGQGNSSSGGQVLGAVSGSGNGSGSATSSGGASSNGSSRPAARPAVVVPGSERPSFVSLEYSLNDSGALVHVVDDVRPKPGEEFSYTVLYKNETDGVFTEANLKVILPPEVSYIRATQDPNRISGNVVEFKLTSLAPRSKDPLVITVKVKEDTQPGANLIFTSVMGYRNGAGTQLATTAYLTMKAGQLDSELSASIGSSMFSLTAALWFGAVVLLLVMSLLTHRFVKIRRNGKNGNGSNGNNGKIVREIVDDTDDMLGFDRIPPTFQPIGPAK